MILLSRLLVDDHLAVGAEHASLRHLLGGHLVQRGRLHARDAAHVTSRGVGEVLLGRGRVAGGDLEHLRHLHGVDVLDLRDGGHLGADLVGKPLESLSADHKVATERVGDLAGHRARRGGPEDGHEGDQGEPDHEGRCGRGSASGLTDRVEFGQFADLAEGRSVHLADDPDDRTAEQGRGQGDADHRQGHAGPGPGHRFAHDVEHPQNDPHDAHGGHDGADDGPFAQSDLGLGSGRGHGLDRRDAGGPGSRQQGGDERDEDAGDERGHDGLDAQGERRLPDVPSGCGHDRLDGHGQTEAAEQTQD